MKLAIIIPYYNGAAYIKRCIASLEGFPASCIFLVDNSEERKPLDLPITYVNAESAKLGFAKAVNIGLQRVYEQDFTIVLILNQDAYFQKGHFPKLIDFLKHNSILAFASPMIYTNDFSRIMPFIEHRYFPEIPTKNIDIPDFVAVALIANVSLMKQLKGFDESFFMYYEDNDLIARARIKNAVKILPNIHVGHENPDLENPVMTKEKENWIQKSKLKYLKRHGSKISYYKAWAKYLIVGKLKSK